MGLRPCGYQASRFVSQLYTEYLGHLPILLFGSHEETVAT